MLGIKLLEGGGYAASYAASGPLAEVVEDVEDEGAREGMTIDEVAAEDIALIERWYVWMELLFCFDNYVTEYFTNFNAFNGIIILFIFW